MKGVEGEGLKKATKGEKRVQHVIERGKVRRRGRDS